MVTSIWMLGNGAELPIAANDDEPPVPILALTNPPPKEVPVTNDTGLSVELSNLVSQAMLEAQRSFLVLQEQLRTSMRTLQASQALSTASADWHAAAFSNRLATLEQTWRDQRETDLAWAQQSNRTMLIVAGSFAGVVAFLVLLTVWFQVRSLNRLAELVTLYREPLPGVPAISSGAGQPAALPAARESSQRLLSAVEQLEQRIRELEHATTSALPAAAESAPAKPAPPGVPAPTPTPTLTPVPSPKAEPATAMPATNGREEEDRIALLLGQGQSLLNSHKVDEALACFDEIIAREPQHAEALMKKGVALEQQEKYKEALEYYDRAIEANRSLTLAYLHKGGVFNQLERFDEALQCYEQALRLQQLTGDQSTR